MYNAFVDAYGDAIAGSPYGDVAWKCIGSTATVDARDNAPVSGPVYRFDGRRVADNAADLWTPVNYYNFAPPITPQGFLGNHVWTGTQSNGTKHATAYLGSANGMIGYSGNYDGRWVQWGTHDSANPWHLYALSEPLTMISPSPARGR